MKRLSIALIAVAGLSGVATASDLPYGNTGNNYAPAFTWAGFYAGFNVGYAWNASNDTKLRDYFGPLANGQSKESNGFTGGIQAGYNFQSGTLVYGIEGDLNIANLDRRDSGFGNYLGRSETYLVKSETSWFGTVRPRVGFALSERFLVFATGGLAFGEVKLNGGSSVNGYAVSGNSSNIRWGWTLGAGAEFAITNNLTIKGEYAYVDLAEKTETWSGRYGWNALTVKDSPSFQLLRAGVNYKF